MRRVQSSKGFLSDIRHSSRTFLNFGQFSSSHPEVSSRHSWSIFNRCLYFSCCVRSSDCGRDSASVVVPTLLMSFGVFSICHSPSPSSLYFIGVVCPYPTPQTPSHPLPPQIRPAPL